MGDGFFNKDKGVIVICSESFTKEEQELLIAALDSKAPFFFLFLYLL